MVLDASEVEVRHVAAVVDDSLCVRVRERDACERRVVKGWFPFGDVSELDHEESIVIANLDDFLRVPRS